jgi:3-deoxy-D-manno-octulosonic-acid transferase
MIAALAAKDSGLSFLITSTAQSSMQVLAANLPPRTLHQFMPLDAPQYIAAFLAHWRPNLSVWAEQDLWPNAAVMSARAGIPLAMINARINAASHARRARVRGLYTSVLRNFDLVAAQDIGTAAYLRDLGAAAPIISPSLKAAAPPLAVQQGAPEAHSAQIAGRSAWLLASSWPQDEEVALHVQRARLQTDPSALLIIAPRDITRAPSIAAHAAQLGLAAACRTTHPHIAPDVQVYIADTFGEMGLWYRLCRTALIGGTFGPTEGHNPWEAAVLRCAILHGPRTANFANDYAQLAAENAALCVDETSLQSALDADHCAMAQRAQALTTAAQDSLAPLAAQLIALMR